MLSFGRGQGDEHRLLLSGCTLPLVESICWDKAASLPEGISERRFGFNRLGSGIDHPISDGGGFCPEWHQSPPERPQDVLAILAYNDRYHLGRCHIVVGGQGGFDPINGEVLPKRFDIPVAYIVRTSVPPPLVLDASVLLAR